MPDGDATARTLAASAVRAKVAAAARRVAEEAIQLHGGMGVTEELNMGRYLRRLLALDAAYGSAESHLRRHATLRTRAARGHRHRTRQWPARDGGPERRSATRCGPFWPSSSRRTWCVLRA
jgi:hypothetical protein